LRKGKFRRYLDLRKRKQLQYVQDNVLHKAEMRNTYRILVRKPEGKRPLARARHRWDDDDDNGC
jgi:hypothetical protein